MHRFANPNQFLRIANPALPWCAWLAGISIAAGLYFGLFQSPPDYQQGETVRIMYIHVPAAWMAMFVYGGMAIASATALIWKHPLGFMAAKASAPIGACFTAIALVTGMLWGKPMWGTWRVWDARLTSMLILLFLYSGYIALRYAFADRARGAKAAAILALVGAVNLPIIKFSVTWWNTLHQGSSVITMQGPKMVSSMLVPLLLLGLAYKGYYIWVLLVRMRAELTANKVRILRLKQVHGG